MPEVARKTEITRRTLGERVTAVLEEVCCLAEAVRASDTAQDCLLEAVTVLIRTRNAVDAVTTALLAEADRLGAARRIGMTLREVLTRAGCSPAVASRLITVGRDGSLLPTLARLGGDGAVSLEHAHAVVTGIRHMISRTHSTLDSPYVTECERTLVTHALSGATPAEITARARALTLALSDSAEEGSPGPVPVAEDTTINDLSWGVGDDGRLHGRFDLDVVTGEALICTLDRATGAPRTDVSLTIDLTAAPTARLAWLGPIGTRSARMLTCDAALTRIGLDHTGAPVEVSATRRLFTGPVRRAIIARDRCCIKCGAPASWTDVHHIVHFVDGGPTSVDNGCLLCRHCHTAVHHQGWVITMGHDRHPYLIPPASVDPTGTRQPAYTRRILRLDIAA